MGVEAELAYQQHYLPTKWKYRTLFRVSWNRPSLIACTHGSNATNVMLNPAVIRVRLACHASCRCILDCRWPPWPKRAGIPNHATNVALNALSAHANRKQALFASTLVTTAFDLHCRLAFGIAAVCARHRRRAACCRRWRGPMHWVMHDPQEEQVM